MRTKYLFFLILIIFPIGANAQKLSPQAQISLITCAPGEELYSVFGHNAVRVKDPAHRIDWVYNYGTFDFDEPGFYVKFVRGKLNYMLSVGYFRNFIYSYQRQNRSVNEQILNLTVEQKQKLFDFLQYNARPENKFYKYDFFFDNCATRVRDVLENELGKDLHFNPDYKDSLSFRDLLMPYLQEHYWSRFGINLILGAVIDRKATFRETMFLPDYLEKAAAGATIKINGKLIPFVKHSQKLFVQTENDTTTAFILRPSTLFWTLFLTALILFYFEYKKQKIYKIFDFIFFFIIGIVGIILFLVWTATDHTAVVQNWNLLWALPPHFFIAFLLLMKKKPAFLKYYFLITGSLAILIFPFWWLIPQVLDYAIIPLLLIIALRSYRYVTQSL
ncbi:MAG: DUF4105 domain-containing protein [Bacteroidales bacterium]|nr:DUF4105 domain-containing protein [Bacteroidales bacterium]